MSRRVAPRRRPSAFASPGEASVTSRRRVLAAAIDAVVSFVQYQLLGQDARSWFVLGYLAPVVGVLVVLHRSRSIAIAGQCFLAVIAVGIIASPWFSAEQPKLVIAACVFGFCGAHFIGARAGVVWTAIGVGVAVALALSIEDPVLQSLAWNTAVLAFLIGAASVAIELQREQVVQEAAAQHDRLRALGEMAFEWVVETEGAQVRYASPGVLEHLGYPPGDVMGRDLRDYIHPDDVAHFFKWLEDGEAALRFEHRARNAAGRWVWCESVLVRPRGRRGGVARWIYASRVVEDERRDRARVARAERLEGVALLAAGLAHDFNNLLMVIVGHAEGLADSEDRKEILRAASQASGLTRQLLAFGREQPGERATVDAGEVVRTLEPILRGLVGEDIDFDLRVGAGPHYVSCAPAGLEQVVVNLVTNSREAIPRSGRIEVTVESDGAFHRLAVRDSGVGMDDDTLERAFDPFFSTKPRYKGTGLGLASAFGLVQQWGGTIDLDSEIGRGTVVTVRSARGCSIW